MLALVLLSESKPKLDFMLDFMYRNSKLFSLCNIVMVLLQKSQAHLWANTVTRISLKVRGPPDCWYYGDVVQYKSSLGTISLGIVN